MGSGGFLSFHQLRTTMEAVLALLTVCLLQISLAEQENVADDASSVANLLLQREVREAARGCEPGDKKCRKQLRQDKKKKSKKNRRKGKQSQTKKGQKGGKQGSKGKGKKLTRRKKQKNDTMGKQKKNTSNKKRKSKKKSKKGKKVSQKVKGLDGARSSSASGSGRNTTGQCFTDMVAKTKKFNKAQVEFRLTKRIETWGKLMKNKKNNSG